MKAAAPLSAVSRAAILRASESPRLQRVVRRHGMRAGAARFVAGETLEECLVVLARLNADGLHANTTLLGEAVETPAGTEEVVAAYERVLSALVENGLRANVALKLTHLGLSFDEELAYRNVERLVRYAGSLGTFIRIDMEQSAYVDATLRTYRRLRESGLEAVGTVLQSYLLRTEADLEDLLPLRPNLRIVKGAYLEPAPLVFPSKREVDAQYVRLVERGLEGGLHIAVATHDERIVEHVKAWTAEPRHRPGEVRVPDALRRPAGVPAPARGRGLQGARRHPVRPGLVPVPDAPPRRAARERRLPAPQPRPRR